MLIATKTIVVINTNNNHNHQFNSISTIHDEQKIIIIVIIIIVISCAPRSCPPGSAPCPPGGACSCRPPVRGREGTVDRDTLDPNCSTGNRLSTFNKRIHSKSSN